MNQPRKKNWWGRNWKWVVPVGCLGGVALFLGFIALIFSMVIGVMRSSGPYKEAVAMAKADPAVQQALGTPIEEGLFTTGNINVSGSSGQADLAIPISGPKDKARIYALASRVKGQWVFSGLVVVTRGTEERIVLVEKKE